jgi:putative lumazine-binding protein
MTTTQVERTGSTDADAEAAVTATVEDYFLGWYDGDPERMRRALHPDLAKRSYVAGSDDVPAVRAVSAVQMIEWTTEGEGKRSDAAGRRFDVTVDEVHDTIATARVDSVPYREYIHLARTPDGWRIVNTLWTWTDPENPAD